MDFDVTDQLLYSSDMREKWEYNGRFISYLEILRRSDAVRRSIVQYSHATVKIIRLIKMYLSDIYSKVRMGKNLSDVFPIQNILKQ
jgi:hypothetical protein